ncbi:MAG: ParB/RepB/Spo0J family partition protein [Nitrospirae bacterium]|nr:MAG: ParB/RepB/Spo0J family partition protein [Nitrospirota bacterium]
MLIESGAISTGHAKVILGLPRPEGQIKLARRIVEGQLSVRQAEKAAAGESRVSKVKTGIRQQKAYPDLEDRLQKRLGTRVSILKSRRGGKIVIHYFTSAELDRLLEAILG